MEILIIILVLGVLIIMVHAWRATLIVLAFIVLLAIIGMFKPAHAEWHVQQTRSNNNPTVVIWTHSHEVTDRGEPLKLTFQCAPPLPGQPNNLMMGVVLGGHLTGVVHSLRYRIDAGPVERAYSVGHSADYQAVIMTYYLDFVNGRDTSRDNARRAYHEGAISPLDMLRRLRTGKTLVIEVPSHRATLTGTFSVGGLGAVLPQLRAACPWRD